MANTTNISDYGYDTSCLTSLRTGRYASGARLVAEAAYRRLTTPKGSLQGGEAEADYGFDLADLIGQAVTPSKIAALPGQIQNELMKDERIASVTVNVTSTKDGPAVSWVVSIEAETAVGPFALQLSVNDVTVSLLGINPS